MCLNVARCFGHTVCTLSAGVNPGISKWSSHERWHADRTWAHQIMAAGVFKLSECCVLNSEHKALLLYEATSPTSPLNGSDIRILWRADVPSFILHLCWLRAKCCLTDSTFGFWWQRHKADTHFLNLILKNIPGKFFPGLLFHNPSSPSRCLKFSRPL